MDDWTNLALLLAEALLYFAVMAGLFRLRHRVGIGLVFCALGAMHFLETYLAAVVYLELPGGLVVSPGSIVLFSGKLAMLLLVYIREDAAAVRQPIYGLLAGNLLMLALVYLMRFHDLTIMGRGRSTVRLMDEMGGLMIWGTILLFIDAILIILLYERSSDWFGGRQLPRVIASAAIVLTFDQIGFFTALYLLSGVPMSALWSGWIAKMGAAMVFGLMTAFYLRYVETALTPRGTPRLSDVFDALTYRQRAEDTPDRLGRDAPHRAARPRPLRQRGPEPGQRCLDGRSLAQRDGDRSRPLPAVQRTAGPCRRRRGAAPGRHPHPPDDARDRPRLPL